MMILLRRILLVLFSVLSLLTLVIILALAFVQTGPGQRLLENTLNKALVWDDGRVAVTGISGRIPFNLAIENISIDDEKGTWLSISRTELKWSLARLLRGRIHIDHAGADSVHLARLPDTDPERPKEPVEKDPFNLEDMDIEWKWPLPRLTVEHVYVNSIGISDQVLDEPYELSLEGSLSADEHGFNLASLKINRLDKPASMLHLSAALTRDPYWLDLDFALSDPGVLQSLMPLDHWPSETSLLLRGEGPLQSWQGQLKLDGQEIFHALLELRVLQDDYYSLQTRGEIYVDPVLLPLQGFDFTADPVDFFLRVGLDSSQRIFLDGLNISSPRLDLKADAFFDPLALTASGSLSLEIPDINPLLMDSGFKSRGKFSVAADFDGPLEKISADLIAGFGDIGGHGLFLEQASLKSAFRLNPAEAVLYSAAGRIETRGFHIDHYTNLPEDLFFRFDMEHSTAHVLTLQSLDLQARDLKARVGGWFDLTALDFETELDIQAVDAQQLIPGLSRESFFAAGLDAAIKGGGDIRGFHYYLDADIKMPGFTAEHAALETLAGGMPRLRADLEFDETLVLSVNQARLDAEEFIFTGAGNMGFREMQMDYSGQLAIGSLDNLGKALDMDLAGELDIDVSARGKIVGPDFEARVRLADFTYIHLDPTDLEAHLHTYIINGWPCGSVELFATQAEKRLDMHTDYVLQQGSLEILDFSLWGHGADIRAELDFDLENILARGYVSAGLEDLSVIGDFLDMNIAGSVKSEIVLSRDQEDQNFSFTISGQEFEYDGVYIAQMQAAGSVKQLFSRGLFQSEITLSELQVPQAELDYLAAEVAGTRDKFDFSTTLAGTAFQPLDLTLKGQYSIKESGHFLKLAELKGVFAHEYFQLDSPLMISHSPEASILSPFSFVFGSGQLSARADFTKGEVSGALELSGLQIADIPVQALDQILGVIDLDLTLAGSPAEPSLRGKLRMHELAPAATHLDIPHALDLTVQASLEQGKAEIDALLKENQTELADLHLNLPMLFSLEPLNASLPEPAELSGRLRSGLELETLAMLLLPPDQLLSGYLETDFTIGGTVAHPTLKGTIDLAEASYEHLDAALLITDVSMKAVADQTRITITEIKASDGLNGRITGTGFFDADPGSDMPWNLELDVAGMRIINHKLALVYINTGDLMVSGNKSGADVSGSIVFESIEAQLPEQAPPGVVDMEVTEINHVSAGVEAEEAKPAVDYPVKLDLDLKFPARVHVRGRGLDSEWSGELKVTGEAVSPSVRGSLNVIRGRLILLDRRFDLERDSNIHLDGAYPPDPYVDIRAGLRQKDMIISVRVHGPALQPEIELSSEPPMPQDEILAWVLFGRDLSSITPFQAITLINATRTLATGRTGLDVVGKVRSFIGVDDIDITVDPDEGYTQFGLGKYIHERVYMEVKKGTVPGTDMISVEVELTPRISLEGNLDSDSDGGIGIFWGYDY